MSDMPSPEHRIRGTVHRVIDGDTIEVEVRRTIKVRLVDCWSPETETTRHPCEKELGIDARDHLSNIARHDDDCVLRIVPDTDEQVGDLMSFDRVVGDVWLDGVGWLSRHMVDEGHAFKTKKELNEFLTVQDTNYEPS